MSGRGGAGSRPVRAYDPGDFVVTDLVDDRPYAVSSISVPVFGADGRVVLALNLTGFPVPVAGAEIRRLAAVARGAAAHVHTSTSRATGRRWGSPESRSRR